jgi:hypothetical protein
MGEYNLVIPTYAIPIGGVDVVLGIQWLRTLGIFSTNYNELFMRFELEGIQYELKGLKYTSSQVIISHRMENILLVRISKGLPPSRDHEHQIELIPRSTPHNKIPYRYPHQRKGEIEKMVQDMSGACIIQPSKSSFSYPIVMVRRKYNALRIFPNYRYLNKITIKINSLFQILIIY